MGRIQFPLVAMQERNNYFTRIIWNSYSAAVASSPKKMNSITQGIRRLVHVYLRLLSGIKAS